MVLIWFPATVTTMIFNIAIVKITDDILFSEVYFGFMAIFTFMMFIMLKGDDDSDAVFIFTFLTPFGWILLSLPIILTWLLPWYIWFLPYFIFILALIPDYFLGIIIAQILAMIFHTIFGRNPSYHDTTLKIEKYKVGDGPWLSSGSWITSSPDYLGNVFICYIVSYIGIWYLFGKWTILIGLTLGYFIFESYIKDRFYWHILGRNKPTEIIRKWH